ncbi:Pimeloyl-ACP methyl ester carboxylesterase [Nocardioides terrae]|uniref:Pimeloyl-ACP methyl ester carboxylesterase n=1 Tax=Nocardioides terrae TaxID=574651 RepID=A0A1I1LJX3_9ACTN|nr:alpha/beta fold hydrolase [Nocardioides terrae]SFC73414.1 Pimeloyl-ACP methyl ester carboxylesterase [Nocardioides terrae]
MVLAYERSGSGDPLVLVHGIGHRRQAWYPVLDRLAEEYDVIAVDLPGHGASTDRLDPALPAKDALSASLRETLDHLGIDRPHMVGNSLGGLIALEAAQEGLARSVTALSPAGFWGGPREFLYVRALFATIIAAARVSRPVAGRLLGTRAGRAAMFAWLHARPGDLDPELARGDFANLLDARTTVKQLFAAAYPFALAEHAAEVPTTIAWSERDHVLLPRQARRAQQLLPNAQHVTLAGVGHVPMPDDPELVVRTIRQGARPVDGRLSALA